MPRRGWLMMMLTVACAVVAAPAGAATPGVPEPPVVLFAEDFEHVPSPPQTGGAVGSGMPQMLDVYTGTAPVAMTYTADPYWLDDAECNGIITAALSAGRQACDPSGTVAIRLLARQLGTLTPGPDDVNHAVSAYTDLRPNAGDLVQLQTVQPVALPHPGRFIAFSVDAAASACGAAHPVLSFFLLDDATVEHAVFATPIDVCTDPRGTPFGLASRVGRFASDGSLLYSGTGLRVRVRNATRAPNGDDFAYDNLRMLDATPRLDLAFGTPGPPGATTRLTLTITNTGELASKEGWSFTNLLPSGLRVAGTPDVTTTCTPATVTAPAGSEAIAVAGDLDAGQASCTVEVNVSAGGPGTYTDGAPDITASTGIDPPLQPATITLSGVTSATIDGPPAGSQLPVGGDSPARFRCSAEVVVASCTATVRRPDGSVVPIANGALVPTGVPGSYVITVTVVDALGNRSTATRSYEVLAPATQAAATQAAATPAAKAHITASQLALKCARVRVMLLDVRAIGKRIRVKGVTATANAGRQVPIRLLSGAKIVARATVKPDGSFETTAPLPPARIRKTNKARYRAELDGEATGYFKLRRRIRIDGLDTRGGKITLAGKITLPLAKPVATIRLRQRTACIGRGKIVARIKPDKHGRFRVTIPRPRGVDAAIYRFDTYNRKHAKHRTHYKRYRTFTLLRGVNLF
jgi:uncharacterized repeat protein (TIGR01451 family)